MPTIMISTGIRHAEHLGVGDVAALDRQAVDGCAAADHVGDTRARGQRAQRGDEGWHAQLADHQAVDQADQQSDDDPGEQSHPDQLRVSDHDRRRPSWR